MSIFIYKLSNESIPASQIFFLRVAVGAMISFAYIYFLVGGDLASWKIDKRDFYLYLVRAALTFVAMVIWIEAVGMLGVNQAVAMTYFTPIWVMIFAQIFLKEFISKRYLVGIIFAIVGMLMVVDPSLSRYSLLGLILGVASTIFWAGYDLICKKQADRCTSAVNVSKQAFYTMAFSAILSAPFALAQWHIIDSSLNLLVLGLGSTCFLNMVVLFLAFKYASVVFLTPFSYSRIIFTAVFAFFLNGSIPKVTALAGVAIIVAVNFNALRFQKKQAALSRKKVES